MRIDIVLLCINNPVAKRTIWIRFFCTISIDIAISLLWIIVNHDHDILKSKLDVKKNYGVKRTVITVKFGKYYFLWYLTFWLPFS